MLMVKDMRSVLMIFGLNAVT